MHPHRSSLVLLTLLLLPACPTPHGVILDDRAELLVDARSAGMATYQQLQSRVMQRFGANQAQADRFTEEWRVVLVGVINDGAEPLHDMHQSLIAGVESEMFRTGRYQHVSHQVARGVLLRLGITPAYLFGHEEARNQMAEIVGKEKALFLLFLNVTTQTARAGGDMQREYQLTLTLVDAKTGEIVETAMQAVRKAYS